VLFEPHYVYSPQLIFIGRFETIRMSQQSNGAACTIATPTPTGQCFDSATGAFDALASPSNLGNITTYTIGYRYQPVHDQPSGFCLAQRVQLAASGRHRPTGGNLNSSELLIGFDFDF
jgi:hypothetical protein